MRLLRQYALAAGREGHLAPKGGGGGGLPSRGEVRSVCNLCYGFFFFFGGVVLNVSVVEYSR